MSFAKDINKMQQAGKKLKRELPLSKDPKEAELEKKVYKIAEKIKKEGIN